MRVRISLIMILSIMLLSACSSNQERAEEIPQMLDTKLSVTPETGQVNQPVTIELKLMLGEEEVTNAEEVVFEVWRANDENHENVTIEHSENGIYKLEKTFSQEGTYYAYAHITAEGLHAMPKTEFVIGQPSEPEENATSTEMEESN